jgi:multidrug resistance efflux pump
MSPPAVVPRPLALRMRDALYLGGPVTVALAALLAVLWLWQREVFPVDFLGEVQAHSHLVTTPRAGRLTTVNVTLLEQVSPGQELGRVRTLPDETLRLTLLAQQQDLEIMRLRLLQDQQRNDFSHLQSWQDLMEQRLALAGARIRLHQAESEFERVRALFEQKMAPAGAGSDQDGFEVALRDRDLLRSEVAAKERLVEGYEQALNELRPGEGPEALPAIHQAIDAAMRAQEQLLIEAESTVTLYASLPGIVMRIYRQQEDYVVEGEELFEIGGTQPERILGFIRHPIIYHPRTGDVVRVVSRSRPRREARTTVQRVGGHLLFFTQSFGGFNAVQERGLPVILDYPETLGLHPGELVDLIPEHRR